MNDLTKSPERNSNTAQAQRQRLKKQITEQGSCTTIFARERLHILSPATRINELKYREGLDIDKIMVLDVTAQGTWHKVARYFIKSKKSKVANDE